MGYAKKILGIDSRKNLEWKAGNRVFSRLYRTIIQAYELKSRGSYRFYS
jgi:hypothetical protein